MNSNHLLGTHELAHFFRRRPINCQRNSRELIEEIRSIFGCIVPMKTLVLAACFAGYAVVPRDGGEIFTSAR